MGEGDPFSPDTKPAFLDPERASASSYVSGAPPEEVRFDRELAAELDPAFLEAHEGGKGPSPGYRERWRAIARYNAMGWTNKRIGEKLNYSPTAVSLALQSTWVQEEVARMRALYETDIIAQVKEAAKDGASFIHETILNESAKISERLDASKWAVEKTTGKAKQEVGVESNTLMHFMEVVRDMQRRGDTIDVTPQTSQTPQALPQSDAEAAQVPTPPDRWAAFLGDNL